ncbi:LytTR family DNA-binding domain-containing protein [Acinetobacter bohemicus]|uniref:LytTR family DNA-binding domain-containing protein n=1 Tax=Acinetobacter lwoffii TaxID=28090 RepID=A0A9D2UR69_ACILW|nr:MULTISPECIES: LytTR family DNA-binding domain-containing protein [Acinetobacter]MDM1782049.1 response regulator transcription factor [Acinetobacter indicus]HJF27240.1 LytTR family DNA-binding domain-containing protein [Acinetobacter lwoffii]MCO8043303.1 LytTR family DNA-binding domain-containing protein [Acinetobacter sp. S4400-12]MCU7225596.1 LytTR family DNA-binding domain-containing protein [Acinetobacter bohemicus]QKQ68947.1 response regulator transcription factor [Acinetobacter sp. 10F
MDVLICDDEPLAVERLSRLVSQLGHQVIATASHGRQAIDLAHQHEPDVILLDIQMPEMDGLICAQHLRQLDPMPAIVFCTAYDQHALDAFKSNAEGYLLKPVMQQELAQVLEHLTKFTQAQMSQLKQKENMEDINTSRQQIAAKTYRGVELVPVENIYYFLADQKYVTVRHKNGSVLIDETLKELELEFGDQFIRIHRNALVSVHYLDGLEVVSSGQYQVRCRELEERLAVSRRHLPILRDRIHKL